MKQGSRVRLQMMTSKTEDRAERHNDVRGTLVADVRLGGAVMIYPEKDGDSPKGVHTSMIREISQSDDGTTMVQTMNTLYKLVQLEESGAV